MKLTDFEDIDLDMMEFKPKQYPINVLGVVVGWLMIASVITGIWVGITNRVTPRAIAIPLGVSAMIILHRVGFK